jgi:transcriptional regulator with XRE-family HTH domain
VKLKEYVEFLKIDPLYFAFKVGISKSAIYSYLSGNSIPTQKIAERIEDLTLNVVTVIELRGEDSRTKAYKKLKVARDI